MARKILSRCGTGVKSTIGKLNLLRMFHLISTNDQLARLCLLLKRKPQPTKQVLLHVPANALVRAEAPLPLDLLRLPVEIKVAIFNQMHDPASATALGLTCKAMYRVYFGFFKDLAPGSSLWHLPQYIRRLVRLDIYTRSLPNYMPLHELIRDFFPKDLVYWNGGYDGTPKFVTRERLAQLIEADKPKWELVRGDRSF